MRRRCRTAFLVRVSIAVASLLAQRSVGAQSHAPQSPHAQPPPDHDSVSPPRSQPPPPVHRREDDEEPPANEPSAPRDPPPPYYYPGVQPVESKTHAPKFSLWTGVRLSFVGFGFSFYENEQGLPETTGNYLGNGFAPQIDVGARLGYRYIPYVYWEHGFMGQGHRFAGTSSTSSTDFYGVGFRYVSGDVDSVGFLTDLSIGKRVVSVSSGGQTYSMSGLEFFRLGLGAEIRVATLFALSPLLSISSGALNDTEGDVTFACKPACGDGLTNPTYKNGQVIQSSRAYVVLSLGLGIHFDVFGK